TTPVCAPAQFVVDEPADDVLIVPPCGTKLSRALDGVLFKCGVEHIGKVLVGADTRIVSRPGERHSEINIGGNRERLRAGARHGVVRPGTKRVEAQTCKSGSRGGPPRRLTSVLAAAGIGIGSAVGIPDVILVDPYGIDALGQEPPAIGVDKPEGVIALGDTKKSIGVETVVCD